MAKRYTVAELSDLMQVSQSHVIGLIQAGLLRAVNVAIKRGRPTWRILESDYLAYEDRQSTVPAVRTTTPKSSRKKVDRTPDYLAEMEKAK